MTKDDKGTSGPADSMKPALKLDTKGTTVGGKEDLNVIPSATLPKPNSYEEILDVVKQKEDIVELGPSVFVCKHIFTELGEGKVKQIFKKNGFDLDNPVPIETAEEKRKRKKKEKERLKAWNECPNSINPAKGVYIDPYCPNLGQMAMRGPGHPSIGPGPVMSNTTGSATLLTPGSIGVSKNQMAFHLSPLGAAPSSPTSFLADEGIKLRLGQSSDGTQCITITYDSPPPVKVPPPCATERETQFLESDCAGEKKGKKGDKNGKENKKKGGKGKKGK